MSIVDRNGWKYYDFWWRGERHQGACHTKNTRKRAIEAAKKTALALGMFGIVNRKWLLRSKTSRSEFSYHIKGQRPERPNTQKLNEACIRHCARFANRSLKRATGTGSTKIF